MSGTTNALGGTPNLLAGSATCTIDGTQYPVVSDAKYSSWTATYKKLMGMDGYHGEAIDEFVPSFIEVTLRDSGSNSTGAFMQMRNSTVVVVAANGKQITGYNMGCMKALEVDLKEGTYAVRFEGPQVIEVLS